MLLNKASVLTVLVSHYTIIFIYKSNTVRVILNNAIKYFWSLKEIAPATQ